MFKSAVVYLTQHSADLHELSFSFDFLVRVCVSDTIVYTNSFYCFSINQLVGQNIILKKRIGLKLQQNVSFLPLF